ncbi:MAG: hypothetical protein ABIU77_12165, partial [Ferruginibacter sp.]
RAGAKRGHAGYDGPSPKKICGTGTYHFGYLAGVDGKKEKISGAEIGCNPPVDWISKKGMLDWNKASRPFCLECLQVFE